MKKFIVKFATVILYVLMVAYLQNRTAAGLESAGSSVFRQSAVFSTGSIQHGQPQLVEEYVL